MAAVKSFRDLVGVTPSTASTEDSVLVIIDAQNEYINGHLKTENVDSTSKAIHTLLEKYRAAKAPLVHILHQTPPGAPVFTPDTPLAAEFTELTPQSSEKIIHKQFPGSFTSTDLHEYLQSTGRKKVVLTGYMAHVCVSTTARQAAEKGYDVVIVKEAVGDRNIPGSKADEVVRVVLAELGDAFASVVSVGDIK